MSYSFSNFTDLEIFRIDGSAPPRPADTGFLEAGEGIRYFFDYTITLTDQGLPNAKIPYGGFYGPGPAPGCNWEGCVGWLEVYAPGIAWPPVETISLNGNETAFINIRTAMPCTRDCPYWANFPLSSIVLMTPQDLSPDVITQSGTFAVSFVVSQGLENGPFPILMPSVAVDAMALSVPEPGTYALLLGGLALIGWRGRTLIRPRCRRP